MEGDKAADNEKELTSTSSSATSKLLSTNKEEKNDSNDTLPTSSTDASTSIKSSHLVSDDPISSTSSEMDPSKPKANDNSSTDVVDKASVNFEAELLGMSSATQPTEKIEENVDDLVNDLETLLGESTDSFTVSTKPRETIEEKTEVTSAIPEEIATLPENDLKDGVSSNADTTTDKIALTRKTTESVDIYKVEDKIDKNISGASKENYLEQKETNNKHTTDISESTPDVAQGRENISSEVCQNKADERQKSSSHDCTENAESREHVERVENIVEGNVTSENTKDNLVQQTPKIIDNDKKESPIDDLPECDVESATSEEPGQERDDQKPKKDTLIVEQIDALSDIESGLKPQCDVKSATSEEPGEERADQEKDASIVKQTDALKDIKSSQCDVESATSEEPVQEKADQESEKNTAIVEQKDTLEGIGSDQKENQQEDLIHDEQQSTCENSEYKVNELAPESDEPTNKVETDCRQDFELSKPNTVSSIDDSGDNIPNEETANVLEQSILSADAENNEEANEKVEETVKESKNVEVEVTEKDNQNQTTSVLDKDESQDEEKAESTDVIDETFYGDQSIAESVISVESKNSSGSGEVEASEGSPKQNDNSPEIEKHGPDDDVNASEVSNLEEHTIQETSEEIDESAKDNHDQHSPNTNKNVVKLDADVPTVTSDLKEVQELNEAVIENIKTSITPSDPVDPEDTCTTVTGLKMLDAVGDVKEAVEDSIETVIGRSTLQQTSEEQSTEEASKPNSPRSGDHSENLEAIKDSSCIEVKHIDSDRSKQEQVTAEIESVKKQITAEIESVEEQEPPEVDCVEEQGIAKIESVEEQGIAEIESVEEQEIAEIESVEEQETAEIESVKEQRTAEVESVEEQPGEDINETVIEEATSRKSNLNDKKEELSLVPQNIPEDSKCSKQVQDISETSEDNSSRDESKKDDSAKQIEDKIETTKVTEEKTCQDECEKEEETPIQLQENIKIVEVTDFDRQDAEVIKIDPVVREPKDDAHFSKVVVQPQKENVENINKGDITHECLKEIENVPTLDDANQDEAEDVEMTKADIVEEDIGKEVKQVVNVEKDDDIKEPCIALEDEDQAENITESSTEIATTSKKLGEDKNGVIETDDVEVHCIEESKLEEAVVTTKDAEVDKQDTSISIRKPQDEKNIEHVREEPEESIVSVSGDTDGVEDAQRIEECKDEEKMVIDVGAVDLLESAPLKDNEDLTYVRTTYDNAEKETSVSPVFKDTVLVVTRNSSSFKEKVEEVTCTQMEPIEKSKPLPEINIRRKTVEQDLEKVVCLSEESSDSDTNAPISSLPKPIEDVPPYDEETDLIKIADEVDQFSDPELPSEESMPVIEEISVQPQVISSVSSSVDSASNLETILAVASLQNESIPEVRVERRLSEKEIREMEAIRMAVASITDSSQDTYDDYLADNSVAMDNSIQEISDDAQEFPSEEQESSSESEILPEAIVEETSIISSSCADTEDYNLMKKSKILPEKDNKSDDDDGELVTDKELSNSDQCEVGKSGVDDELDEKPTSVDDNVEKIESITITESSEVVNSLETQNDDKINETESTESLKELLKDHKVSSEIKVLQENAIDIAKVEKNNKVLVDEKNIVESSVMIAKDITENILSSSQQTIKENDFSITIESGNENLVQTPNDVISKENTIMITDHIVKENEVTFSNEICKTNAILATDEVIKEDKTSAEKTVVEANKLSKPVLLEQLAEEADTSVPEKSIVKKEFESVEDYKIAKEEKETVAAKEIATEENEIAAPKEKEIAAEELKEVAAVEENKIAAPKDKDIAAKELKQVAAVEENEIAAPKDKEIASEELKEVATVAENEAAAPSEREIAAEQLKKVAAVEENEVTTPKEEEIAAEGLKEAATVEENKVSAPVEQLTEERPLRSRTRRGNKVSEPLSIVVEVTDKKEKVYSPKITIKPVKVPDEEVSTTSDAEGNKGSLKMTITKQSDKLHSILKVFDPEDDVEIPQNEEERIPKLIIKPKMQQVEQQHSPKMTTRSSKVYSPTSTRCSSPRITIKPVTKPTEAKAEALSPLKITFKPVVKLDEGIKRHSPKAFKEQDQKNHNPKIIIKPIPKPSEVEKEDSVSCTPKVTIKPIKRHIEETEGDNEQERSSPKIIIKPVVKPVEQDADQLSNQVTPKLKIKPIKKQDEELTSGLEREQGSPKISIKPIIKPPELQEEEETVKERIVLKINKGSLPTPTKDSKKREHPEDDRLEKVAIKLKFSTTGGHTHIVQEGEESNKRQRKDSGYSGSVAKKEIEEPFSKRALEERLPEKNKRLKTTVTPDKSNEDSNEDLKIVETKIDSPIIISEDSRSQHSADCVIMDDVHSLSSDISKIADIASRTTHIEASPILTVGVATPTVSSAPKRRGRPRKVPLEIREELIDPPTMPQIGSQVTLQGTPVAEALSTSGSDAGTPEATPSPGGRPKRSCRGQNVMATLGIKPRKPRGGGRGRGGKVNMGDKEPSVVQTPVEPVQIVTMKPEKEVKVTKAKLKLMQKASEEEAQKQRVVGAKPKTEEAGKTATENKEPAKQKEEEKSQKKGIELNIDQKGSTEECRKALEEEQSSLGVDTNQKELGDVSKKELSANKQPDADNDHNQNDDAVKEELTPPKKKKEDKTPPRKLEVTTRRQKAQLQKEGDNTPVETPKVEEKKVGENPKSNPKPSNASTRAEHTNIQPTPSRSTLEEIVIISTDEDSCEKEDSVTKLEELKGKSVESTPKNSPERKVKAKNTPPKRVAEESEERVVEEKKVKLEVQDVQAKKIDLGEETAKLEVQKEKVKPIDLSEKKTKPEEQQKQAEQTNVVDKKVGENLKVEEVKVEEEKESSVDENKEEEEEEKKIEGASAEEEAESGEDSEAEKRREWVLQKKQEAIKKCRAKRMEKLARAAELKRKRQEQAAQQREARKAAEEAEKAAAERSRATKRYGRYGVPKPQISLIDEPVRETAGTIKSHMGLFDPETERINITQPIRIDDDSNFDKEKTEPLKHLQDHLTPVKTSPQKPSAPEPMAVDSADDTPTKARRSLGTEDVVMVDEETRMSADFRGSRAYTPAKQAIPPPDIMVEDSQGSVGTEGGKSRSSKAPKMEVFQDLESVVFNAEQLAEYSWNGQGPFMLQEQVAQYLGIKSFKRKYPNITRRPVDMQERDYLKEHELATEAQCDLGLTAVIAQDILDIMYADFQDKYEDYCRCQREKQAKELANKQKALSQFTLKPGFDKLDILEQAVQSAAAWNQQLNKARREERKAHMDLQNMTVHYPKSKMKVVPTPKIGHYPVALVPGQFTDHYKEFTPTELNNLPLNTMCYDEIKIPGMESASDNSSSGSDSDSESNSESSSSESSCDDEDCKECVKKVKTEANGVRETDSDDVVIIENDASSSDSVVLVSVTAAPVTA